MLLASVVATGLATLGTPDPAVDCPLEAGPVRVVALTARPPGGAREDALERVCAQLSYTEGAGAEPQVALAVAAPNGDSELRSVYPEGTQFRATLESSAGKPLTAVVTARNARAHFDGRRIVVRGRSTRARYAVRFRRGQPHCQGKTVRFRSFFDTIVLLDSRSSGIRDYRGSTFGSNAQSLTFPTVAPDGFGVELLLSGCGDSRGRTREGFFQGFLPVRALARLGIDRQLLLYLPNRVLDYLLTLEDNGAAAARVDFRRLTRYGVLGVAFDYRLSYSFHRLRTKSIRRALKVARRCRANGGRLRVRRGRLACQKR